MLLVFLTLLALPVLAENRKELPLWELGVGLLPFRADHYRGSPQNKWYFFAFPAYVVRGKNIEAENGYIRKHIARISQDLVLDLSFNVGLNVNSKENDLRAGMRSLDPTFELGPMLRYYWWKSKDEKHFLNLEMPFRAVYATDITYIEHVGYYSIPYLNLLSKGTDSTWGWGSEISIGPQFGSTGFHNRFYAVGTQDVTAQRGYYQASSGYSGTQLVATFNKRIGDFAIIPFLRYDYLDGAVYNDSPLYKNAHYTFFGIGIVWYISHSKEVQTAPTMVK